MAKLERGRAAVLGAPSSAALHASIQDCALALFWGRRVTWPVEVGRATMAVEQRTAR
jgi:hypothetical protein